MQSYALEYHQEELLQMLREDDEADHYSVTIKWVTYYNNLNKTVNIEMCTYIFSEQLWFLFNKIVLSSQ